MWKSRFMRTVSYKPMDAIGFILAGSAIIAGVLIFAVSAGLFGAHVDNTTSSRISGSDILPWIFAVLQFTVGSVWMTALFNKHHDWSLRVRRACSLIFFYVYCFYGTSAMLLNGLDRLSWVTTYAVAAIVGVKYLWLSVAGDKDDG